MRECAPGTVANPDAGGTAADTTVLTDEPAPRPPESPAPGSSITTVDPAPQAFSIGGGGGAPAPAAAGAVATPGTSEGVTVARAAICRDFSTGGAEWRCVEVEDTVTPGVLVFYTRIRTPQRTRVDHEWYRGETLVQRVPLTIGANEGAGYRTYSRQTVSPGASGPWRVELRSAGGDLLPAARFDVR